MKKGLWLLPLLVLWACVANAQGPSSVSATTFVGRSLDGRFLAGWKLDCGQSSL